jgi:hypothetical protein
MDTGTFSMIIFGIIIIVGGYLIFTDAVQGRAKIILIIVLTIMTFALIIKFGLFSSYKAIITSPVSATSSITSLSASKYKYTARYSLSTWVYVNDWNLYNGQDKEIIKRTLNGNSSPKIYLDPYDNCLNIEFCTGTDETLSKQMITQIPISTQKWVNITCCFSDTNIDTYMNGKLVDTTIPNKNLYFPTIKAGDKQLDIHICPNAKGFSGFISNTNYYSDVLTPQDAWNIYKKGYSSDMFGNLLNKYNASFTFYENQNEVVQFYIM